MDPSHAEELKRIDSHYDRLVLIGRLFWVMVFLVLAFVVYSWWFPYQAFDAAGWKNGDDRTRLGMAKDLVSSGILIGKTKEEAIQLLGEPYGCKAQGYHLSWDAGSAQSLFNFNSYLNVRLDAADRAVECILFEN